MYGSLVEAVELGYDAVRCTFCQGFVWWNATENPGMAPHHDHGPCLERFRAARGAVQA